MVTQDSTQTGLLNLIAELRGREKEQEAALVETRRNIAAVQRALDLLRERYGLPTEEPRAKTELENLRGLSLPRALLEYARINNGKVKVTEVKRKFLEAGIIGTPKTAYQRITSTLIRSDLFVHAGAGTYRLVNQSGATGI
jgi:hypothetical protein